MAIITASPTGGFWSATTAWNGAVVPTLADDVILSATSGNITVSDNRNCLTLSANTYTGTFTINNGNTLTVYGTNITLGSGMTYTTGTTGVLSTQGNQLATTINFNNKIIPRLTLGKTTAGTAQLVNISGTTPTIQNLVITNGASNAGVTLTGAAITITSSISNTFGTFGNGTGQIIFSGNCTISSPVNTYISGGFIVGNGSSLQMINDVYLQSGAVTFSGTGTLSAGTNSLFCPGIITFNTSTVNWWNVGLQATGQIYPLSSALNILNNFTIGGGSGVSGGFAVNVYGSLLSLGGGGLALGNCTLNMLGSGTIALPTLNTGTININTTNPSGYTFGSATYPTLATTSLAINLSGTSVAQVYSTTGHTLSSGGNVILSTNNTATGANIGGSQIIWGNITLTSNQTTTLTYDTIAAGNLSVTNNALNGAKLYVAGNLINLSLGMVGTSTIELSGSSNTTWASGGWGNNIIVNKTSGATVTTGAAITWGNNNRTLVMNSPVILTATTFTTQGTPLIINNSSNSSFSNLTIAAGTALTISGGTIPVTSNLTLNGSVTFSGTSGWNCANLLCSTAGSLIVLQTGNTYNTTTSVNMLGAVGTPIVISGSSVANRTVWTLAPTATQSIAYVNGTNINSSLGQTIWSFGGVLNNTLNWGVGTKPQTVSYTFIG